MKSKLYFRLLILTLTITAMTTTRVFSQKPGESKVPDYSTTERSKIPVEYTWNIADLYPSKDAWKADKQKCASLLNNIEAKAKDWTSSPQKMLEMLKLSEEINLQITKLYSYASNQCASDLGNTEYQNMKGEMQSLAVSAGEKFAFFSPDVLKLGAEKFKSYLKAEPKLEVYRFGVEDVLRSKDHILPEDQQKIISLTGLFTEVPSRTASMLNDLEFPSPEVTFSDGKTVKLNYANYMKYRASKNPADRELAMKTFYESQSKFGNTLGSLLDGGMKQDYFSARASKFDDCLSARLFGNNIPTSVYTNLISQVRANTNPLYRFMNLKKRLLKLEKFHYPDLYASAVPSVEKTYSLDEAKDIILKSLAPLGKDYTDMIQVAYKNRWMDMYPNKGKESGAYSSGVFGVHPYIKLNFLGEYDDVSTMAHELGHAMHSWFSDKNQAFVNSQYATFIAEIASTFNENMLVQYMLKNEKDDLFKLYLLDNYLDQVRATLYRQTLFAEFELAMHKRVEEGNSLTPDWLNEKYLKLTRDYYGSEKGMCEVGDYMANEWSRIPHFYMNYYVFQYSTGIIASLALSEMVLTGGPEAQKRYLELLKSGGSDYPIELLKKAGVDMTSPAPYNAAFKRFDELVGEMEKLVEKLKL